MEVILDAPVKVTDFLRELQKKYVTKFEGSSAIINLPGGYRREEFKLNPLQGGYSDRVFTHSNSTYFIVEGNDDNPENSYRLRFIKPDKITGIESCLEDLKKLFDSLNESHPPILDDSQPIKL